MKLLKQADFSTETDLKERLRQRLFPCQIVSSPSRQALDDDDTAMIFAAGDPSAAADHMGISSKHGLLKSSAKE